MTTSTTTDMNTTASDNAATLTIEGKLFGRGSKALFPNFQMTLPPQHQGQAITLRDLLDGIVREQVAQFRERQEKRTVLNALTQTQIADGVAKGKIDSGGTPDAVQEVDADEAVKVALQAFEDGVYFVFVNDEQKESLSDTFAIGAETRVTFLRLVALAGG